MSAPLATPTLETAGRVRRVIRVHGRVQGVGFRPFVHRQASRLGLAGWVANAADGVVIEAEGAREGLDALLAAIHASPPPLASVGEVEVAEAALLGETAFAIRPSALEGARTAQTPPDVAVCEACLAELFDPADRRHRHPFISCTDCGPRLSLIEDMPYDRSRTSMRGFPMCEACRADYEDPASRRFHAEPIACPDCGPSLSLLDAAGRRIAARDEALSLAERAIARGGIVAVKGIGGYHLMADARGEAAVRRLRAGKRRPDKPFAVMFPDLDAVRRACRVSAEEAALLISPERPIVLLRRGGGEIAPAVAPGSALLGAILPYSPQHHLIAADLGFPVVATSANLSDEPIATGEAEALERLEGVADLFLAHDRPIVRPVEDSVARIVCDRPLILRRARGYAPAAVAAEGLAQGVLALGGHLKTTVALSRAGEAVVWPHIGDLETLEARAAHERAAHDIARLHDVAPRLIACDLHPDYATSREANGFAAPVVQVQHHLAHVAACMADNGLAEPVLGVAWDGVGYGPDGTIWGGEFLAVARGSWRRAAHLQAFPLPGGDAAVREPRRAALGLLYAAFGEAALSMDDLAPVASFTPAERRTLAVMLARGVNTFACTSAGRLFDAVAALAGLAQRTSFEGQAATRLEEAAGEREVDDGYDFPVRDAGDGGALVLDWAPALAAIIADVRAGAEPGEVSAKLHAGLAGAVVEVARRLAAPRVALTGGCFQNARLTRLTVDALRAAGIEPLWHRQVPPNDGGLALGQAVWAAWTHPAEGEPCA
ncbi:carbamoyltransferase HypF [Phenylobacterium sp.]|uniref:carbamoyltransferase HypF n=1 Tax=Phenylobacterium sp. TaxID=1871053 RepID=UPI0035B21D25